MPLSTTDTLAIQQLVALHGHLVDSGELHRLHELFTPDVVYDVTAFGKRPLRGIDAFRAAAVAVAADEENPVGHHVTNIVITEQPDGTVTVRSKGLGVLGDGRTGSVVYADDVARTPAGWRITTRQVLPSRGRRATASA